jgi:hypothetical protein
MSYAGGKNKEEDGDCRSHPFCSSLAKPTAEAYRISMLKGPKGERRPDRVLKMADGVAMIDAANPVPTVRGPYKKRDAVEISN